MATTYDTYFAHGAPLLQFMSGAASGVTPLDADTLVPEEYLPMIPLDKIPQIPTSKLPDSILSGLTYMGIWDASTTSAGSYALGQLVFKVGEATMATMGLEDAPIKGHYWRVTAASNGAYTENITGDPSGSVSFAVGDYLVVESVIAGAAPDSYVVTFSKVDNSETVTGIILNGVTETGTIDLDDNIGTTQIQDAAVTSTKIGTGQVSTGHMADLSISHNKVQDNAIDTRNIAASAIDNSKVAVQTLQGDRLVDNAITTQQLAADAVESSNILNGAILQSKFPANFDPAGRTMTAYVDMVPPLFNLSHNSTTFPPSVKSTFSTFSNISYLEVTRGQATGDIELMVYHRVQVPDNFAAFKMSGGQINLGVLINSNADGGQCEATVEEVHGHEVVANVAPGTPFVITNGSDDHTYSMVNNVSEPQFGGNTLVPGQTFLVVVKLKLAGVGGSNQSLGYGGLKVDYLYQV